jgi:hypothetical protein
LHDEKGTNDVTDDKTPAGQDSCHSRKDGHSLKKMDLNRETRGAFKGK